MKFFMEMIVFLMAIYPCLSFSEISEDIIYNKYEIDYYNLYPIYLKLFDEESITVLPFAFIGSDENYKSVAFMQYYDFNICEVVIFYKDENKIPVKTLIPVQNCDFSSEDAASLNFSFQPWHPPRIILLENENLIRPFIDYFKIKNKNIEINLVNYTEKNFIFSKTNHKKYNFLYAFSVGDIWKCFIVNYNDGREYDSVECY